MLISLQPVINIPTRLLPRSVIDTVCYKTGDHAHATIQCSFFNTQSNLGSCLQGEDWVCVTHSASVHYDDLIVDGCLATIDLSERRKYMCVKTSCTIKSVMVPHVYIHVHVAQTIS